jgi:nitric oxide reductase NorE protein
MSHSTEKSLYYPPGGILIWIIIFLELFTFGAVLIAMVLYSKDEPQLFHESKLRLNVAFGTINTVLLLTSGYFMAKSAEYFKLHEIKKTTFFLKLTMLGGLLFLIIKSIEYFHKIEAGLTISYNMFFSFYWMLTLFHVVHVIVGLVILGSIFFGIQKKSNTTTIDDFEASAGFWHMCDLIWLLLFPVIYLIF